MSTLKRIRCTVERITYESPETGYVVLKGWVEDYKKKISLIGNMFGVKTGSLIEAEGDWKIDSRYGRQFEVLHWKECIPSTTVGVERFLGSGLLKGINKVLAKRIVDYFMTDTIRVIEEEPYLLTDVPGIGLQRARKISESWKEQKHVKELSQFLADADVNPIFTPRIYRRYEGKAIELITENPYRLVDEIWGIGFKTAEQIAGKLHVDKYDARRIQAGILFLLGQYGKAGNTYAEKSWLIDRASSVLKCTSEYIEEILLAMKEDQRLIITNVIDHPERQGVYLKAVYHAETGIAKQMQIKSEAQLDTPIPWKKSYNHIPEYLNDKQRLAVKKSMQENMLILTGGPGTGKTTVVKTIAEIYQRNGKKVLQAAPTGRAAKRMATVTGLEAMTIHRMLEYNPSEGYKRNSDNPLEGDLLIIDECSMIDVLMMNAVLMAVPITMRILFIGDAEQLQSVGAGNVFCDMVQSGIIPKSELTKIFRQKNESRIISNAELIRNGKLPNLSNGLSTDFFFLERSDPEQIKEVITELVFKKLGNYYKVPIHDIQVLCPLRVGITGAINLNLAIRDAVNPDGKEIERGGIVFREHDRVMQIRNNYEKEIFNGEYGVIEAINCDEATVDFDGRVIRYKQHELDELTLAYAITIHKSQGCEIPIVVIPVSMEHQVALQRRLFYTAVTRAKRIVVIIGTREAVQYAVETQNDDTRKTMLKGRMTIKK